MTQPRTFLAQWDPSRAQGPCFVYFSAAGKGRGAGGKAGVKINKSASCCSHSCYIITTEQVSSMSCSAQCNILSDVTLYSEAH